MSKYNTYKGGVTFIEQSNDIDLINQQFIISSTSNVTILSEKQSDNVLM